MKKHILVILSLVFLTFTLHAAWHPIAYDDSGIPGNSLTSIDGSGLIAVPASSLVGSTTLPVGVLPVIVTTNNASQLSSGTVTDGLLSSNIPRKNGANVFSITGNSFAGTTTFSDTTNTATLSVSGIALLSSNLTVGDTTSSTGAKLVVIQNGTTVAMFINTNAASSSSGGGMSGFAGTTPTGADQRLGFLAFGITDKVTATNSVAITGFSSQAWTNGSAQGSYLAFETTPNGSTTRRQVGRISQDGVIISTNGFASNNTNQYVIASTGWTNTNSFSCTALITATAATATLSDGTNTVHTYTTITGELSIPMHPSYKITAASGLSGVAILTQ